MQTIAGMLGTGRRLAGPGIDLVEVAESGGAKYSALVVDAAHREHPSLNGDLEFGLGFMEQPDVTGLVRLSAHSRDEGAFLYPTGTIWSVAELVRELAAVGEVCGIKAGLELCYMAGEILVEAADQSSQSGLLGHGSVDPWKLVLKADGQVSILGYGLPRPEIEAFLDDDTRLPSEDSLRYCAPENLSPEGEPDLSSDLFTLSLIALELMVGRPVYDGLVNDVKQQAQRGEAARKLYQWRDRIPTAVREVLGKALKPDPDTRYRDGLDYVYSVHDLLGGIDAGDGPSLRELVTQVRARQKRGKAAVSGKTGSISAAELAELAADIDAEGVATTIRSPRNRRPEEEASSPEKPRWQRATRNRVGGDITRSPRRGRRTKADGPEAKESTAAPVGSARDRLLRRLRERGDGETPRSKAKGVRVEKSKREEDAERPTSTRRRRPGGRAAALLERLRSSSGETIPPLPPSKEAPPSQNREHKPSLAPQVDVEEVKPAALSPSTPPIPTTRSDPEKSSSTRKTTEAEAVIHPKKPSKIPPTEMAGSTDVAMIAVTYEGRTVSFSSHLCTASVVAQRAAQQLLLESFDAMGARVAVWRLSHKGRRLSSDEMSLPEAVDLERVANDVRIITLSLPGGPKSRVAFGGAVPLGELKPVVARMFALDKPFALQARGRDLRDEEVLADSNIDALEICL